MKRATTRRPVPAWERCGKVPYATKVDALIALKSGEVRATTGQADHAPKSVYRCRRCSRWHLTSRAGRNSLVAPWRPSRPRRKEVRPMDPIDKLHTLSWKGHLGERAREALERFKAELAEHGAADVAHVETTPEQTA